MSDNKPMDIVVKVGSYTDRSGQEKARFENIGKLLYSNNGPYLLIRRTFNPAGVPVEDGRDMIVASLFEKRDDGDRPEPRRADPPNAGQSQGPATDDDTPF